MIGVFVSPRLMVAGHRDRGTLAIAEDLPSRPYYPRAASSRRSFPHTPWVPICRSGIAFIGQRGRDTHTLSMGGDPITMAPC